MEDEFKKYGFCVVRNVLTKDEVLALRIFLDDKFNSKEPGTRALLAMEVLENQLLFSIPFKQKIVDSLKKALGHDLCYFTDYQLMRNIAGDWHIDGASELYKPYFMKDDYKFAKCGVFLQSSNEGWGGSIVIAPKGHKFYLNKLLKNGLLKILLKNFINKFQVKYLQRVVHVEPGDMIFFDSRLPHKSQWPSSENMRLVSIHSNGTISGVPPEHTKYAFYWNACNPANTEDFLINSKERAVSMRAGEDKSKSFFTEYLSLKYPEDYPQDFVALAEERGISIASLDKIETKLFKDLRANLHNA